MPTNNLVSSIIKIVIQNYKNNDNEERKNQMFYLFYEFSL